VRWVETGHAIHARGIGHVLECGPGKVLSQMVKRIEPEAVAGAVHDPASLAEARGVLA
jgi:[acyl-carrier-protein] S-malonyltransferase